MPTQRNFRYTYAIATIQSDDDDHGAYLSCAAGTNTQTGTVNGKQLRAVIGLKDPSKSVVGVAYFARGQWGTGHGNDSGATRPTTSNRVFARTPFVLNGNATVTVSMSAINLASGLESLALVIYSEQEGAGQAEFQVIFDAYVERA